MSHQNLKSLFAACAVCIATFGLANTAHAKFWVCIDNYGTNGNPTWANTGSTVTIQAEVNSSWVQLHSGPINTIYDWSNYPVNPNLICFDSTAGDFDDVDTIRFTIDGGDALYMDRVILAGDPVHPRENPWYWGSTEIWGWNGGLGFCMSDEEESAGAAAYCNSGFFATLLELYHN